MNNEMSTETPEIHAWERRGLGTAPFRFVCVERLSYQTLTGETVFASGSCDYCGMCISDAAFIRSSDGKSFKVGLDCALRLEDPSNRSIRHMEANDRLVHQVKLAKKCLDAAKRKAKAASEAEELDNLLEAQAATLMQKPHPKGFDGLTAYDYACWMRKNAGTAGIKKTLKAVREMLG